MQRAYCSNVYTVESIGSKWWSCCSFRSYHTFGGSPFSFCSSHNFARIYFGSAPFAQSKLSKKCACRQIGSQAGGYVRGQAVGQAGGRAGGHRELPQLSSRRKRGHCTVGKILYLLWSFKPYLPLNSINLEVACCLSMYGQKVSDYWIFFFFFLRKAFLYQEKHWQKSKMCSKMVYYFILVNYHLNFHLFIKD